MTPAHTDKLIFWLVAAGFLLLFALGWWAAFGPVKRKQQPRGFDVIGKDERH